MTRRSAAAPGLLAELQGRSRPRRGWRRCWREIDKLERVRAIGLPADLFADASEKRVAAWRARAASLPVGPARRTRAGAADAAGRACAASRTTEITDSLVDLLIGVVHRINARAERPRRAGADRRPQARARQGRDPVRARRRPPSSTPTRPSGAPCSRWSARSTLRDLVREAQGQRAGVSRRGFGPCCAPRTPPTTGGCSRACWRRCEFRCNNTAYRPVMDALELLRPLRATAERIQLLPRPRAGAARRRRPARLARGRRR